PTKAPEVTCQSLADFVQGFRELRVSMETGAFTADIKFTVSPDFEIPAADDYKSQTQLIDQCEETDWDLKLEEESLDALSGALSRHAKVVSQAFVRLGDLTNELSSHLSRVKSPENEIDLVLDGWSLEFGPIRSGNLSTAAKFLV